MRSRDPNPSQLKQLAAYQGCEEFRYCWVAFGDLGFAIQSERRDWARWAFGSPHPYDWEITVEQQTIPWAVRVERCYRRNGVEHPGFRRTERHTADRLSRVPTPRYQTAFNNRSSSNDPSSSSSSSTGYQHQLVYTEFW